MNQGTNQVNDIDTISRLISSARKILTEEEGDTANPNYISQKEVPELRSEIKQTAERIYDKWGTLKAIVQRHEATIQKRWTNKPTIKRRGLLLKTWPNMARGHRPDIALESKPYSKDESKKMVRELMQGRLWEGKMYGGPQREALLMSYINLHDLIKTEPLLLMINARARQPPHTFSSRDLQLSTHRIELTAWRSLEGHTMSLDGGQSVPETYGELRQTDMNDRFCVTLGADPRLAGRKTRPGDGLWVLEIQERIYNFLLDIVQEILHDIPSTELTGPKYIVQPEPPLPSANSRGTGVVSLATTNLEAIYSSPRGMDLHRLQVLVTAKANEEEDKLWALREDPGRFSEDVEDLIAHRPEYAQDLGAQHGFRTPWGSSIRSLEDLSSVSFLMSNFFNVEFWGNLARDITGLVRLKTQHFDSGNIEPSDPLPEEFAMALYKVQSYIGIHIDQRLSILYRVAYSSPPLRPYVQRARPVTLEDSITVFKPDKKAPRHIYEFMNILAGLFDLEAAEIRGHIASVQFLVERYDIFMNTIADAHQAVSPYVAQEISTLALVSECLRQIHLFRPLDMTFDNKERMEYVQIILEVQFVDRRREVIPLEKFKMSGEVTSMATAIVKSPYPAHKKRSAANVRAMQNTETLLEQMWDTLLAEMEQQNVLPMHSKNVLFLQGRVVQQTPDWVEPVKPIKKQPPQVALPAVLVQPFGRLNIDDNNKADFVKEKAKIKTRGTATPQTTSTSRQVQTTEQGGQSPVNTIQVDRRAMKVFGALFHTPSSPSLPGEVPWNEFLHAMGSAGFWTEKLYGSVWQFTPRDDDENSCVAAGMRSILFHEPHPHSRIPFWHARRHGRRLARAYGWSGQTFVVK